MSDTFERAMNLLVRACGLTTESTKETHVLNLEINHTHAVKSSRSLRLATVCAYGLFAQSLSGCGTAQGIASDEQTTTEHGSALTTTGTNQKGWRDTLSKTPTPGIGCFQADFPATTWTKVACQPPPTNRNAPARAVRAAAAVSNIPAGGASGGSLVGNGNEYVAIADGLLTLATGSFPTVSGVMTENDQAGTSACSGTGVTDAYELQLNSQLISTPVCIGPNCVGWEQFLYSSHNGLGGTAGVFIEYWLYNYTGATCPTGFHFNGPKTCQKDTTVTGVPNQPITSLASLSLQGEALNGGADQVILFTPLASYAMSASDSVLDLSAQWEQVEFNVVGDENLTEACFNSGSTIGVQIALSQFSGSTASPSCSFGGLQDSLGHLGVTGETNNLTLVQGSCCATGGSSPAITFLESNTNATAPFCLLNDITPIVSPLY